jgi:predicted nuclease of predicted toxin-antitoxin system
VSAPRLLLDENVTWELAVALQERGHDVVHVRDLRLLGADDATVLAAAVRERRTVLTHDIADFLALARDGAERGDRHFGILLTRADSFRRLLSSTLRALTSRTAEDLEDVERPKGFEPSTFSLGSCNRFVISRVRIAGYGC